MRLKNFNEKLAENFLFFSPFTANPLPIITFQLIASECSHHVSRQTQLLHLASSQNALIKIIN
jgi:hypothetical protein